MPKYTRDYSSVATGELAGATSATQMPDIPCQMVNFKARSSNAGSVFIGVAGVTVPDGSTDTTSGWELAAGEETGYLPASNLNKFYRISQNAGDDLVYMLWR